MAASAPAASALSMAWISAIGSTRPAGRISARSVARLTATLPTPSPGAKPLSTQMAFGQILNEIARDDTEFARRIVTTAPDVTVSTNLGPWVNRRGLFAKASMADTFKDERIPSMQKWEFSPKGQHVELGIAEMNLFIMLAALGLVADHAPAYASALVFEHLWEPGRGRHVRVLYNNRVLRVPACADEEEVPGFPRGDLCKWATLTALLRLHTPGDFDAECGNTAWESGPSLTWV